MDKATVAGALKYDADKPMMDLVFDGIPHALLGMGTVLTYGFKKYKGKHGWKALEDAIKRYEAAMIRHQLLKATGEVRDLESGLPHSWHIATNAAFIAELEEMKGVYATAIERIHPGTTGPALSDGGNGDGKYLASPFAYR